MVGSYLRKATDIKYNEFGKNGNILNGKVNLSVC